MDQPMTKEESYAERRQLFKNIWDMAMHIDEKDPDIISKPKVIKTLRLTEVDRYPAGKKKKQRIKNLRTVCNKILDFCDRQDADDFFYEQMAVDPYPLSQKNDEKPKKSKHVRNKVTRAKSLISPLCNKTYRRKGDLLTTSVNKTSRNTSPIKIKRTTSVRRAQVKRVKTKCPTRDLMATSTADLLIDAKLSNANRRIFRKKVSKRKRQLNSLLSPDSSVKYNNLVIRVLGRIPLCKPKEPLRMHKINIS